MERMKYQGLCLPDPGVGGSSLGLGVLTEEGAPVHKERQFTQLSTLAHWMAHHELQTSTLVSRKHKQLLLQAWAEVTQP